MKKILSYAQINEINQIQNTFPNLILMNPKEMAILDKPKKFEQVNKPRLNKKLADSTIEVLGEISFLLDHLPLSYRYRILDSKNCNEFFKTIMDINSVNLSNLNEDARNLVIQLVNQLLIYSITVLKTTMPQEFKRSLTDAVMPFIDLLTAISNYGNRNSLKDIPQLYIPNLLFTE